VRLVEHWQARALLHEEQERVAGVRCSDADPLRALAELHGLAPIEFHVVSFDWGWRSSNGRDVPTQIVVTGHLWPGPPAAGSSS
jgi:hypothetical protein